MQQVIPESEETSFESVTEDILTLVWQELDYRWDSSQRRMAITIKFVKKKE
jgi:hypothetical protein